MCIRSSVTLLPSLLLLLLRIDVVYGREEKFLPACVFPLRSFLKSGSGFP